MAFATRRDTCAETPRRARSNQDRRRRRDRRHDRPPRLCPKLARDRERAGRALDVATHSSRAARHRRAALCRDRPDARVLAGSRAGPRVQRPAAAQSTTWRSRCEPSMSACADRRRARARSPARDRTKAGATTNRPRRRHPRDGRSRLCRHRHRIFQAARRPRPRRRAICDRRLHSPELGWRDGPGTLRRNIRGPVRRRRPLPPPARDGKSVCLTVLLAHHAPGHPVESVGCIAPGAGTAWFPIGIMGSGTSDGRQLNFDKSARRRRNPLDRTSRSAGRPASDRRGRILSCRGHHERPGR